MKINILNYEPDRIGGGWSAARNLYTAFNFTYEESDVVLICGATQASHEQVRQAQKDGKKIVLRIDNHLLPSRNRATGMSRMQSFADVADLVIYQSQWARDYLSPIIGKDGVVILNGVDTKIFNTEGRGETKDYLYVRSSRIAEKGWERARYWFSRHHNGDFLYIAGKFSSENLEYKFDFINNEKHIFLGEIPHERLANEMKTHKYFLYSYFMDCCSNTLLEAKASGMEIIDVFGDLQTGGAPEIMECEDLSLERMCREYKEAINVI